MKAQTEEEYRPPYLMIQERGEIRARGEELWNRMDHCQLCPRECGADRLAGERGDCGADSSLEVSSYHPHHGEERPLSGSRGSGTIFLSNCSLRCVFCINAEISQGGVGSVVDIRDLAQMMLALQSMGCHNINFVSPSHYLPHILLGIHEAAARGLILPLIYNCSSWERLEVLYSLDGIVDIYLADLKYSDPEMASVYSPGAASYAEVALSAILAMQQQTGTACINDEGLATRGLMIRHLVMPNQVSGSFAFIDWVVEHLPSDTYVNLMSQYRPMYKAYEFPEIARPLKRREYEEVIQYALESGLTNLDIQGYL